MLVNQEQKFRAHTVGKQIKYVVTEHLAHTVCFLIMLIKNCIRHLVSFAFVKIISTRDENKTANAFILDNFYFVFLYNFNLIFYFCLGLFVCLFLFSEACLLECLTSYTTSS